MVWRSCGAMLFFDIETTGLFDGNVLPQINCVVVVDGKTKRAQRFYNKEGGPMTAAMVDAAARCLLSSGQKVCGFNSCAFDLRAIALRASPAVGKKVAALCVSERHCDMMLDFAARTGYYTSLASMASALGCGKKLMGSGEDAIAAWADGYLDQVLDYCEQDVRLLCAITEHAMRYGRHERITKNGRLQTVVIENYELYSVVTALAKSSTVDQSWMTDPPDIGASADWALERLGLL